MPLVSAGNYCPNDELKDYGEDDVQWVEFGSGDLPWGKTTLDPEYEGDPIEVVIRGSSGDVTVPYVLKVNDFDLAHTQADLSIAVAEAGAKPVREVLILDGGDYSWFQLGHELKVELTDITEDSGGTPHAKLKYYERGKPEFEIEIESGSETYEDVSVSGDEYFPGREKEILVTVRNKGDGWAECINLEVGLEGFALADSKKDLRERDIQSEGGCLYANLGWLEEGEERSINFTVRAPAWDGASSPFGMDPCNITVLALGNDILGYGHEGNETLSCTPVSPKPGINVVRKLSVYSLPLEKVVQANRNRLESNSAGGLVEFSNETELYMSSWHIEDGMVYGLRDYCVVKDSVYNLEAYVLNNLTFEFSTFPEDLLVAEAYRNGRPVSAANSSGSFNSLGDGVSICIPGKKDYETLEEIVPSSLEGRESYSLGYILIPTKPGEYKIESFSAAADCYGYSLSDTSGSVSFTVRGPNIIITKSIEDAGDGNISIAVRVKNEGDRAAWTNLTEPIPLEAGFEESSPVLSKGGVVLDYDMPLNDFDFELSKNESSYLISISGVFLPPKESYDLKYTVRPESLQTMDLPPAEIQFLDRNFYTGTVRSSFFRSGAEVRQEWDYYENRWEVLSENWDASNGTWAKDWDPLTKQWTGEKASSLAPNSTCESSGIRVEESFPPSSGTRKEPSPIEKIQAFFSGILAWEEEGSGLSAPLEEQVLETPGNESFLEKIKSMFSLLPFF